LCGGIRSAAYAGTFGATPATPLQQDQLSRSSSSLGNNTNCNLHLMRQINGRQAQWRGGWW